MKTPAVKEPVPTVTLAAGPDADDIVAAALARGYVSASRYMLDRDRKPDPLYRLIDAGEIPASIVVEHAGRRRRYVDPATTDGVLAARICPVNGCGRPSVGKTGYCGDHWQEAGHDRARLENHIDLDEVRRLYEVEKKSAPEIATMFETRSRRRRAGGEKIVTAQAVYGWLRRAGVEIRVTRDERLGVAKEALGIGAVLTVAEVAATAQVTPAAVHAWYQLAPIGALTAGKRATSIYQTDDVDRFLRDFARGLIRVPGMLRPLHADGRRSSWQDAATVVSRLTRAMPDLSAARVSELASQAAERQRRFANFRKGPATPEYHFEWAEKFLEIREHLWAEAGEPPTDWRVAQELAREDTVRWPLHARATGWERDAARRILRALKALQIPVAEKAQAF